MRNSNLFGKLLASTAVAVSGLAVTAVSGVIAPAAAQDYTSGSINGTVTNGDGAAISGAEVTVTSKSQGFTRSATTSAAGAFNIVGLPTGDYDITVTSSGNPTWRATDVKVLASQATAVDAVITGTDEIVVTGSRFKRDFASTTSGLNLDVAELVKNNPVGRDLTSLVLLAPGTSQGDNAFGNLASIGGSSVAENAYYVNGLNTTNFDNYLGSAQVPFEMYRTVEVKSGGYPAEFGRATGGIVNAVTKSGSNDFMAAIHLNWTPEFLRSRGKDIVFCDYVDVDNNPATAPARTDPKDCRNGTDRRNDTADSYSAIVEAGGPIIKDKLFVYGLAEFRKTESLTHNLNSLTAFNSKNTDPFWGVKVDAYPIDNHHLELTVFDTRNTTIRNDIAFSQNSTTGENSYGLSKSVNAFNGGGLNYVAKYTGDLTDFLTVSAAYGRMRDRFDNVGIAGAAGLPRVLNSSGTTINGVPNGGNMGGQTVTSTNFPYTTQRLFWRGDVDLRFNALGEHHIRAGFDVENNTLTEASVRNGGNFLFANGYTSAAAYNAGLGGAGLVYILRPGNVVELNYFNSGGNFKAKNKAFYIQDEWKPTDQLTLTLGLRRDDFGVRKGDGTELVNLEGNYGPRIGASYKFGQDDSTEVYGFWGRYFLPFASNTAFRMTGQEYFFRERWNYSGFDANGIPIKTTQITSIGSYQSACPFGLTPTSSGNNCSVTGNGTVAATDTQIASNLKATQQDEIIVGLRHKLDDLWSIGLSYTRREMKRSAEDVAIDAAVNAYCAANGISGCSSTWTGFHQYVIVNPGQDVTVALAGLDGRTVTFTAAELGYPKAKRTYDAVEFTFERKNDGVWGIGGSYTWSKSLGNSEGFVQSDFGQDDAGITQDFDQPGFTEYAYGYLPNDRRHRFKLWGAVNLSDNVTIGANYRLESPRSLSCLGWHPTDVFAQVYGAASHYCDGVPSARGTAQKTDWVSTLDVSTRIRFEMPTGQQVTFRADVFNLFNSQAVQKRDEIGELDLGVPSADYGSPTLYQAPRTVRLGLDITF